MRNSAEPIPWTHRDSRPHSQAELDEEESFDVYRRTNIPRPIASDLHQRLEHYQAAITRILTDAEFREEVDIETETAFDRAQRARTETTKANVQKKGLYSTTSTQREAKRREKRQAPPNFFTHLERIFSKPQTVVLPAKPRATLEALYEEYHIYSEAQREVWRAPLSQLVQHRNNPNT